MLNGFIAISIVLLVAAGLSQLINLLLDQKSKDEIKDSLEEIWLNYSEAPPTVVIHAPLRTLSLILDFLFGKPYISGKSLLRASLFSVALLISSLSITGLYTNTIFGIDTFPWDYYGQSMQTVKMLADKPIFQYSPNNPESHPPTEEEKQAEEWLRQKWEFLSHLDSPTFKIVYSLLFIFLIVSMNALFGAVSLAITRLMLNEIVQTDSITLTISILIINLILAVLLATTALIGAIFISYLPFSVLLLVLSVYLLPSLGAWSLVGLSGASVAAWKLTEPWFSTFGLTTVLPSILLCLVLAISALLYPLRGKIHSLLGVMLLRAIEHDKGVFAFIAVALTSFGAAIGGIAKLLE